MKLLARLVLVVGAAAIFAYFMRSKPRDVTLVYNLAPPGAPATLEVEIHRGAEVVRRSELAVPPSGGTIHHSVRLPQGDYSLTWRLFGPQPAQGEAAIDVRDESQVVVPLKP